MTSSMSSPIHVCPTCGSGFHRPSALKVHLNTHTGEKPFVCQWKGCNKTFSVNSNMRRHLRTHTDQEFPDDAQEDGATPSRASSRDKIPQYHYPMQFNHPGQEYYALHPIPPYAMPVYGAHYYQPYPQEYIPQNVPRTHSRRSSETSSNSSDDSSRLPSSTETSNALRKRRHGEDHTRADGPSVSEAFVWRPSIPITPIDAQPSQSFHPSQTQDWYRCNAQDQARQFPLYADHSSRHIASPLVSATSGSRTVYSVHRQRSETSTSYSEAMSTVLSWAESDEDREEEDFEYEKRVMRMVGAMKGRTGHARGRKRQRV